jgi:asparaginyl-tRNA synthetase
LQNSFHVTNPLIRTQAGNFRFGRVLLVILTEAMTVIHVDEVHGSDSPGSTRGSDALPFRTLSQAYLQHSPDGEYRVKKANEDEYKPASKSALKKAASYAAQQQKKAANAASNEAAREAAQQAALEQAKAIKIQEDPSLAVALQIALNDTDPKTIGKLRESEDDTGVVRVKVQGRVHRVAKQGALMFVTLRRGHHLMQCLLAGQLSKTYDALVLQRETAMEITGELWKVPDGERNTLDTVPLLTIAGYHAPLDRELHADYFTIIAAAPGGQESFSTRIPADFNAPLELRHLYLRHEKPSAIMHVRSILETAFNTTYNELGLKKASPPALVQTQVEGV